MTARAPNPWAVAPAGEPTPGPWVADADGNRVLATDARQTIVCRMGATLKHPSVMADALLVTASPDLFAALWAALPVLHAAAHEEQARAKWQPNTTMREIRAQAIAALDKARGLPPDLADAFLKGMDE